MRHTHGRSNGERDPGLPATIWQDPQFGLPGHTLFLSGLAQTAQSDALQKFVDRSRSDPNYAWTGDLMFLLGDSSEPAHRALVDGEQHGIAAFAVSHQSARIGDAASTETSGQVSAANAIATATGVVAGQTTLAAIEQFVQTTSA